MQDHETARNSPMDRDKALFHYTSAVERGDWAAIAAILHLAEEDAELERMILEVNEVYVQEFEAAQVAELAQTHLPSGSADEEEVAELSPLTVGDVVARMQSDDLVRGWLRQEFQRHLLPLRGSAVPLPDDLREAGVTRLLAELGAAPSKPLQKLFCETATFLMMGREQMQRRWLAAARRQSTRPTRGQEFL